MPGTPRIDNVKPTAAIPSGEISISGTGFGGRNHARPMVHFGQAEASLVMAAETQIIARVPDGAGGGVVRITLGAAESQPYPVAIGAQIADNLHAVANPAVDSAGNVYVTFSGQRGQKVPVSLYKVTPTHSVKPFVTELDESDGIGARPRRHALRFLPQRRHDSPNFA